MLVFGLASEVFEDRLFPVPFHMIPVVDLAVTNRVVNRHCFGVCNGLITNVEIKVLDTPLGRQIAAQK